MEIKIDDLLQPIVAEQKAVREHVQSPAEPQDIEALKSYAYVQLDAELSQTYISFLSCMDGMDFNGTVIYAATPGALPGGGLLPGFREANAAFRQGGVRHHVLYGETGDELFAQDQKSGLWSIIDRGSLSDLESFSDADALFERILKRAYEA